MADTGNFRWPWPHMPAETLLQEARTVSENAYAPYSHFKVGAALMMSDGSVVLGCNVENASYGMTICAERSAVCAMVPTGRLDPVAIAIAGGKPGTPCPPCGACRQVIAEFAPNAEIIVNTKRGLSAKGGLVVTDSETLLPQSFNKKNFNA